jgi:glycosyltransferase involved in cell wall biosynthesis/predicted metal-dependent phosphoesterase TrpH
MDDLNVSRVDMHCHSTASEVAKLGVQRAVGLPECATPPAEVYEIAKARGMDFVTITDHDTIDGALELADRPDCFVSEELTAWFRGEPQAVHVLCYGIEQHDHEWLQANARDVEACAEYLHDQGITCALAHPFYSVAAPLTPRHRRLLADLFPIWETRNGSRAHELNLPAAIYVETHGGTGIGGSDDHAGIDIGRTFTETPAATSPEEFLARIRAGDSAPHGDQGSAAKWAHAAIAIATRTFGGETGEAADPQRVLGLVQRVVSEADVRGTGESGGLGSDDARALLKAWLEAVELDLSAEQVVRRLRDGRLTHADLYRSARRAHERKLAAGAAAAVRSGDMGEAGRHLFEACTAVVPYVPAAAFLARERAKVAMREGEPMRVAVIADGLGATHGVARTLHEMRERGVPGFEVELLGTDPCVDRRLPSVAEVEPPYYPELALGVPSLADITDALCEGRYDLVHVVSPGPAGAGAALVARVMGIPQVASHHTELDAYARLRSGDPRVEAAMKGGLALLYAGAESVLSPSAHADVSLHGLGVAPERIGRWDRGVDIARFGSSRRDPGMLPGAVNVLYAGRLTREKGIDLLADAFLTAHARDPRLHLVLAGGGPDEELLRERVGVHATFLGWLEGDELARAYASADVFLFPSRTDTFGQVVLEAQASGLPVVAVAEGGPAELIEDGVSGRLCPADPQALARAVWEVASTPELRARLAAGGLRAVRARTWERSLGQLAGGYSRAIAARAERDAAGARAVGGAARAPAAIA